MVGRSKSDRLKVQARFPHRMWDIIRTTGVWVVRLPLGKAPTAVPSEQPRVLFPARRRGGDRVLILQQHHGVQFIECIVVPELVPAVRVILVADVDKLPLVEADPEAPQRRPEETPRASRAATDAPKFLSARV